MYKPKPIVVDLPADISALTERLSESCHDTWALAKIAEGLTDHPDLVPYSELSEATKDYDRKSAMGTLRAIYALGYRIEKA